MSATGRFSARREDGPVCQGKGGQGKGRGGEGEGRGALGRRGVGGSGERGCESGAGHSKPSWSFSCHFLAIFLSFSCRFLAIFLSFSCQCLDPTQRTDFRTDLKPHTSQPLYGRCCGSRLQGGAAVRTRSAPGSGVWQSRQPLPDAVRLPNEMPCLARASAAAALQRARSGPNKFILKMLNHFETK